MRAAPGGKQLHQDVRQTGQVLRIETTLHAPGDLKVLRPKSGDPNRLVWQPLRKGIADINRWAELCEASNRRYLGALSEVDRRTPAGQLLAPLCQPVTKDGRRMRGLRPHGEDAALLAAVVRGEFVLKGFRNADIRQLLFGPDPRDQANPLGRLRVRRPAAAVGEVRKSAIVSVFSAPMA